MMAALARAYNHIYTLLVLGLVHIHDVMLNFCGPSLFRYVVVLGWSFCSDFILVQHLPIRISFYKSVQLASFCGLAYDFPLKRKVSFWLSRGLLVCSVSQIHTECLLVIMKHEPML